MRGTTARTTVRNMKRPVVLLAVIACALAPARLAGAHELIHAVNRATAVVVTIAHADGEPLAGAHYAVLPPGETLPFQSGLSDAAGRVVFLPDRPGDWCVRAGNETGHGVELTIAVGATAAGGAEDVASADTAATPAAVSAVAARPRPLWERSARLVTGLSLLFGVFGLIALFARRR